MKKIALTPDLKVLIAPLALVLVMLVLAVIVFRVGITKIGVRNEELAAARKNEAILAERVNTLREISAEIGDEAKAADAALPSANAGLIALSQLKKLAVDAAITIVDFGIGSESKEGGLSRVEINLLVEGPGSAVISFVSRLNSLAPILVPTKIRITYIESIARANIRVYAFWAALPAKLPSLTEPIIKLTSAENEIVAKVSALTQPEFLELAPQSPITRDNPF